MRHGSPIFGRALLCAALLATLSGRSQAEPPRATARCGQRGHVTFDATTTLVDADGHPLARFSGGESAVTFVAPPAEGSELAKIETGTGRGSFRLSGFVKASELRIYTTSNVPIVSGHVWFGVGTRVVVAGRSEGKVRLEKQLTTPFNQRFSATADCAALSFAPPTPPPFSPPGAARVFLMKGDALELFGSMPPTGAALLTLQRSPQVDGVRFYSSEQRGGFVHVQFQGEVSVDAWARAEQLTPLPRGETIDPPQSSFTFSSPPQLQLPTPPPRTVKSHRDLPLRSAPKDGEPPLGVVEQDTDVLVMETSAGWAKVLPKSLHVLP
ncbi:MAG TPA: hypothetical protein VEQ59_03705 [Polyangiaceae bacterium]|nr:hypothetical protein [Polyangiaceae bacterium]